MRLLAGGYHASAYSAGDEWVVKFYDEPPALELVAYLGAAGIPVAAPLRSFAGALASRLPDGRYVAVFPFVKGGTPDGWPVWHPALLRSLGSLIRRIHGLAVPPGLVASEGLDISFEGVLLALLANRRLPYREEAAAQLDRLRSLRSIAPAYTPVLCHTDIGGDNIVVTPSGEPVLLDWDEAVFGPPENDFALFARDEPPGSGVLGPVLDGYGSALDPVRLAFCRLRRYLGDACVRLSRLADPNCPDPSAVEADLVAWGVRPWRELPDPH